MKDCSLQAVREQPATQDYLERIAIALEALTTVPREATPSRATRSSGILPGLDAEVRTLFAGWKKDVAEIRTELGEIKQLLTAERGEVVKDAYTVDEVAEKTKLAPFTVRHACNKGRIQGAYKAQDRAWRIPRASLLAILTNGLPPE